MIISTTSEKETQDLAIKFIDSLPQTNGDKAFIVGLYGDLGSGKTTFMKGVAKYFDIKNLITSPTFVIMKVYKLKDKNYKLLVHIDAYRLENKGELKPLGFKEMSGDSQNIIFIEWPENVKDSLPENHHKISFKFIDENTRRIEF